MSDSPRQSDSARSTGSGLGPNRSRTIVGRLAIAFLGLGIALPLLGYLLTAIVVSVTQGMHSGYGFHWAFAFVPVLVPAGLAAAAIWFLLGGIERAVANGTAAALHHDRLLHQGIRPDAPSAEEAHDRPAPHTGHS